jgi:predicted nucleic acid-binding protein
MILIDTNVILYALDADDKRHETCLQKLEECRSGRVLGGVAASIVAELAASLTWPGRTAPLSSRQCKHVISRLMASKLVLFEESRESLRIFLELLSSHRLSGQDIHDAHHASVGLAAGCDAVLTFDLAHWRRFQQDGLRVTVP